MIYIQQRVTAILLYSVFVSQRPPSRSLAIVTSVMQAIAGL